MKIIKEFMLREIAGEYILIPTGSTTNEFNGMITLTETAAFIYNHIEQAESFDDLLNMIVEEYDIDKHTVANDAYQFINHMLINKMVALTDKDKNW